jgi:hypothetical protein
MKEAESAFKILDGFLIGLVIAVAIVFGIHIYGNSGKKLNLVIQAPTGTWIYALNADRTIEIPGALGKTVVAIKDGEARIIESACPNKTCIAAHAVSKKGEWNACLPNKVIIRVEGGETNDDEVDAIAE